MAYSNQSYQQQYMDQQEMMHNNSYYYNAQSHNNSIDEGVGDVPHTPTHTSSQMGGEPMMDVHNMTTNHCVRRGQFQTPPPLQSVGPINNIPPESLQSPDSGKIITKVMVPFFILRHDSVKGYISVGNIFAQLAEMSRQRTFSVFTYFYIQYASLAFDKTFSLAIIFRVYSTSLMYN